MANPNCDELSRALAERIKQMVRAGDVSDFDGAVKSLVERHPLLDRVQVADAVTDYYARTTDTERTKYMRTMADIKRSANKEVRKAAEQVDKIIESGKLDTPAGKRAIERLRAAAESQEKKINGIKRRQDRKQKRAAKREGISEQEADLKRDVRATNRAIARAERPDGSNSKGRVSDERRAQRELQRADRVLKRAIESSDPARIEAAKARREKALQARQDQADFERFSKAQEGKLQPEKTAKAATEAELAAKDIRDADKALAREQGKEPKRPSLQDPDFAKFANAQQKALDRAGKETPPREVTDEQLAAKDIQKSDRALAKAQKAIDPETQADKLLAREIRARDAIKELQRRLEEGDLERARPPRQMTEELERLEFEKALLRKEILRQIEARSPRGPLSWIGDALNIPRSLMASGEFSGVLRQGGFVTFGNPGRAARNLRPMLEAAFSEKSAFNAERQRNNRPNAPDYQRAGLEFSAYDGKLSEREEGFQSTLVEKIPIAGKFVRGSDRAYVTFLNNLRADSYDALVDSMARDGEVTIQDKKLIANYINAATGRVGGKKLAQASAALSPAFFSARYAASRFQLLSLEPIWHPGGASAKARKLVAREYLKYLMGVGTILTLGALAGGEIEKDPRSSDFGKLRFGDTRTDFGSGLLQPFVLMARMISGKTKSTKSGRVTPIVGDEIPYGYDDAYDIGMRFIRSKLAPAVGSAVNIRLGKDIIGQETTLPSEMAEWIIPLSYGSLYELAKKEGIPTAMIALPFEMLGASTSSYKRDEKDKKKLRQPFQVGSR